MNPTAISFAPLFVLRLSPILAGLAALVAARFRTLGPVTNPLWARINRTARRLARLMARLEAGELPRTDPRRGRRRPARPGPNLPRGHAWLVKTLGYQAAGYASQLRALLDAPETRALLAAAPSAARTLRPLCRLLGLDLPSRPEPSPPLPLAQPSAPVPAPPPPPARTALPNPPCPRVCWPWFPRAAKPA